jgi:predicted nucleic acid-binding protein
MIYLDTSVALAHLFGEERHPPDELWSETLFASRLLEYELWTRLHARSLARIHAEAVRGLLARVAFVELTPNVLARAIEGFPGAIRTLDALHLASADFMLRQGQTVELASYDDRMLQAARRIKLAISPYSA